MTEENENEILPSKLANIATERIKRNPHNPRQFFDPIPMRLLQHSIEEVGILVPLLVYEENTTNDYVILDGERRWRCALALRLPDVPANVIEEPSALNNILRMFNIHNVREPWELMPTALKLELIIREINTDNEIQLSQITSLPRGTVRRCKTLLSFDKYYQDMMMVPEPEDRIKPDLFIEMHPVLTIIDDEFQEISAEFPRNALIEIFINKYLKRKIVSVTDFRKIRAAIRSIGKGISRDFIINALLKFLREKDSDLSDFVVGVDLFQETKSVQRSCQSLIERLTAIDKFPLNFDPDMKSVLEELKKVIESKLASM